MLQMSLLLRGAGWQIQESQPESGEGPAHTHQLNLTRAYRGAFRSNSFFFKIAALRQILSLCIYS